MRVESFPLTERGVARQVPGLSFAAYYPEPLPRRLNYSSALVSRLDFATAALHRLAGVGRLLPNPSLLIAPHVRLEAVLSSKIEGTRSEINDLLRFEAGESPGTAVLRDDVAEVRNHVVALNYGVQRLRDGFPLSLRLLREVHGHLMEGVRGEHATPGEFRRTQNWIGGSSPSNATYVPPPVPEMTEALSDLEAFLHDRSLPPLIHLALAHYQFEVIHPFLDGNGRLGRLLVPLVLIERQILPQPLLYLSVFLEENRDRYYELLLSTSQSGDLEPWIDFFLQAVAVQATDAEERTVRLVERQSDLRSRLMGQRVSMTAVRAAEFLFSTPYVSATTLSQALDVSFPTAPGSH